MIASARLDGRVAALRCIALEAWAALEVAVRSLGIGSSALIADPA